MMMSVLCFCSFQLRNRKSSGHIGTEVNELESSDELNSELFQPNIMSPESGLNRCLNAASEVNWDGSPSDACYPTSHIFVLEISG